MTPEVKKRIEQIRQGIVPEGYVKDKDGIYPRDWASKKIGQWLKLAERSIVLQDEEEYQLVTIRRGFGGVDSRGSFLGKNVLVKNYFIVKTGDFIISKRQIAHGACGIVLPELDGAVVSNEYNVFLPQDGTNIQMFNLMMQLPHYKRLFYLMSDGVHIEKLLFKTQDWMKRTLAMPLLKEQKKIAEILSTQDKAIELQGRKIEELKRFKKGCLEKLFPRKGQKVPEKRFPGFTDDWEQRKFDEVFDCTVPNNTLSRAELSYDEGTVLNVHYGDVLIKYGSVLDVQKDDIPRIPHRCREDFNGALLQDGDVIIADTAEDETTGKACEIGNLQGSAIVSGLHTMVCRPRNRMALGYLGYYLNSNAYHHQLLPLMQGIKVLSLSRSNIQKTSVSYPIAVKEQQLIAYYFSQLDNLITLHQRKLEEMKKQKKALMQLLLTGIVRVRL